MLELVQIMMDEANIVVMQNEVSLNRNFGDGVGGTWTWQSSGYTSFSSCKNYFS